MVWAFCVLVICWVGLLGSGVAIELPRDLVHELGLERASRKEEWHDRCAASHRGRCHGSQVRLLAKNSNRAMKLGAICDQ